MIDEFELDQNKRIAIIYSLDDLFIYIIKICYLGDYYYIGMNGHPEQFGNIDDAKRACRKHKIDEAYIALSNSYQELDSTTDHPYYPLPRYDYQRIYL